MIFGMDHKEIAEMLGGYMAGVTVSGVLWAIFQNNANFKLYYLKYLCLLYILKSFSKPK